MTVKTIEQLITEFNIRARTTFNKTYEGLEPMLKDFAYEFDSGAVEAANFYVNLLFSSHRPWTGTQSYKKINRLVKQQIFNQEIEVEGIEIPRRSFLRSQTAGNISGIGSMYDPAISSIAEEAKNAAFEDMLPLIEQGAGPGSYGNNTSAGTP